MTKIILTDYPKVKHIEANYRGMETERLLELRESMFRMMMGYWFEEGGGYVMNIDREEIEEELKFRNVPMEEL